MKILKVEYTAYVEIKDDELKEITNRINNIPMIEKAENTLNYKFFRGDGKFVKSILELEAIDKDDEKVI